MITPLGNLNKETFFSGSISFATLWVSSITLEEPSGSTSFDKARQSFIPFKLENLNHSLVERYIDFDKLLFV